ncbi:glycosyltransferase [Candidatus Woesearchaeota archaeon]|jgi:glycosyltransferase involved in cell wall biosynthesis|nr:glycosyltransferase [Candidatus Woesearchaeota archaeon]MBT4730801.1 glycosyltransferase [Candidatus Woesearchaeota archaeon]
MKVLMLSIDKKIFEEGSDVQSRMIEYGQLFDELHIVVYTKKGFKDSQIASNVFLYPTNTGFKPMYFSSAYRISKEIIRKHNIDIITSQEAFTNKVAIRLKRKFKDIKLQVQIHTDFLSERFKKESFKNLLKYKGYVRGVKVADCVRVVSESIKDKLIKYFGIDDAKISVLPIFIDIEKIKNTAVTVDLRKKYPQFEKIVLMVSRLEKEKNIPLAIAAFKEVIKRYPKTGLVIVGSGSEKINLKLNDNIVLDGWQSTETIYSYYKTADLFLTTSDYEGYGITIIEALASGLPVLSTDVGIAREAGAEITNRNNIGNDIVKYIESGSQTAKLANYPYKNRADYLDKFKQSFICAF